MRIPVPALLLPLFLAGCALPPAVTVASLALSGASYATTGKSTTDHAISAVMGEDCALHRVVNDEDFCDPDGDVLIALDDAETPADDWNLDPEFGAISANSFYGSGSADILDATATPSGADNAVTALAQASVVEKTGQQSLENLIALATEPSPRGSFVNARPAPKPRTPPAQ